MTGTAKTAMRRAGPPLLRIGLLLGGLSVFGVSTRAAEPPAGTATTESSDKPETAEEPKNAASTPPGTAPKAPHMKPRWSLRLRGEYDYRAQGSDRDSDLYAYLYGSARDLYDGRLDFYLSARLHSDLDKPGTTSLSDDPFWSLDDSDGVTEQRLLQFYGDLHDRAGRLTLRAGRQYVEIADYLQLDGGQFGVSEEGRFGGRAYVGQPVSYYSSVSGDLAGGLSFVGRPWEGNRLRLTFARYYDEGEDASDQNYFLDVQQSLSEETRTRGQFSVLNEEFRMGRLDLYHFADDGKTDLALGGSYWGEFDARTRAYSPLYRVLGEQQPYSFFYARLTQQINPVLLVSPGVSLRFADSGENDFNNRDYQNYDLTFTYEPVRALSASLALQYWSVENDDSFLGVTFEARYKHRRLWEISGGSAFAQYTYDTYSDISYSVNGGQTVFTENGTVIEESPYVYTYFLRAKWNITRRLALRLQFEVEDDRDSADLAYRGRGSLEVRL